MITGMDRRLVFGINPVFQDSSFDSQMVAKMVDAHCQSARFGLNWDLIQPDNSNQWLWGPFDEKINLMYNNGIEVVGTPWWAKLINKTGTATGGGSNYLDDANGNFGDNTYGDGKYDIQITSGTGQTQTRRILSNTNTRITVKEDWTTPPAAGSGYRIAGHAAFVMPEDTQSNRDAFNNFCQQLANRYAGKVRYFEFWNEPNGGAMLFTVNVYTLWLGRCRAGLRSGNSGILLSVGGLDGADTTFLTGIYNNVVGSPDDYFDAVGVHPYNWGGPIDISGIANIRTVMVSHDDSDKYIWLTEYGWNLNPNPNDGHTPYSTPEQQSQRLLDSLALLYDSYTYFYVTQASHHTICDWTTATTEDWMGLCDYNLNPRPAYNTFRDYATPRTPRWESKAPFKTPPI
ncbi:MAG: hypothetical protein M1577_03760 [Chloroflexi bacterium]|nr:hypothetical protein [Chloroflexota bacterium]